MDIIETLHEIAQNERHSFIAFEERLTNYCMNKKNAVTNLFRILKRMEIELGECLNGRNQVNVERNIIVKVLKTIRIEIEIIRCRMKHPGLFDHDLTQPDQPFGKLTNDNIDLVELIHAIKMTVDRGKVSIKALQECIEYVFQYGGLSAWLEHRKQTGERNTGLPFRFGQCVALFGAAHHGNHSQ